jgi:ubiquinone/menaquinone biosynthesis C-methylase UbiE
MSKPMSAIQAEFDRIALHSNGDGWNHNNHYHDFLLKQVPAVCSEALEIGCGTGEFARLLAQRSERVLVLDLSPEMIRVAREQSQGYSNITFEQADALTWDFPVERFDCIAAIATLHHVPLETILVKMASALKPGGTLLVLDLFKSQTLMDRFDDVRSILLHMILQRTRGDRRPASPEAQQAWDEHGKDDIYPTIAQVRQACAAVLPGAQVKRHLLWRYSIVWMKGI